MTRPQNDLPGLAATRLSTVRDAGRALTLLRPGVNHVGSASFPFSAARGAGELINSVLSPYPVITTEAGRGGQWQHRAAPGNLRPPGRDRLDVVNPRVHGLDDLGGALAGLRRAGQTPRDPRRRGTRHRGRRRAVPHRVNSRPGPARARYPRHR